MFDKNEGILSTNHLKKMFLKFVKIQQMHTYEMRHSQFFYFSNIFGNTCEHFWSRGYVASHFKMRMNLNM